MTLITQQTSKKGFTLFELLVSIAIIMIMSALIIPFVPGLITERNVYNAAIQLQQDLLYIQNNAITNSTTYASGKFEIYLYPQDNEYYVEYDINAVFNPTNKTWTGNVIKRKLPSALDIFSIKLTTNDNNNNTVQSPPLSYVGIIFDNLGVPNLYSRNSDDGIYISNVTNTKVVVVKISKLGSVSIDWIKR